MPLGSISSVSIVVLERGRNPREMPIDQGKSPDVSLRGRARGPSPGLRQGNNEDQRRAHAGGPGGAAGGRAAAPGSAHARPRAARFSRAGCQLAEKVNEDVFAFSTVMAPAWLCVVAGVGAGARPARASHSVPPQGRLGGGTHRGGRHGAGGGWSFFSPPSPLLRPRGLFSVPEGRPQSPGHGPVVIPFEKLASPDAEELLPLVPRADKFEKASLLRPLMIQYPLSLEGSPVRACWYPPGTGGEDAGESFDLPVIVYARCRRPRSQEH